MEMDFSPEMKKWVKRHRDSSASGRWYTPVRQTQFSVSRGILTILVSGGTTAWLINLHNKKEPGESHVYRDRRSENEVLTNGFCTTPPMEDGVREQERGSVHLSPDCRVGSQSRVTWYTFINIKHVNRKPGGFCWGVWGERTQCTDYVKTCGVYYVQGLEANRVGHYWLPNRSNSLVTLSVWVSQRQRADALLSTNGLFSNLLTDVTLAPLICLCFFLPSLSSRKENGAREITCAKQMRSPNRPWNGETSYGREVTREITDETATLQQIVLWSFESWSLRDEEGGKKGFYIFVLRPHRRRNMRQ